jgi:hypothetical protein
MSGAWFKLDAVSYQQLQLLLEEMGDRLTDATPVWHRLVGRWQDKSRTDFPKGQARAAKTGTRYARNRRHAPLVKSGQMKSALQTPQTAELSPNQALIGVQTRGGRGAWQDLTYVEIQEARFQPWRPLRPGEIVNWSQGLVGDLRRLVETGKV